MKIEELALSWLVPSRVTARSGHKCLQFHNCAGLPG